MRTAAPGWCCCGIMVSGSRKASGRDFGPAAGAARSPGLAPTMLPEAPGGTGAAAGLSGKCASPCKIGIWPRPPTGWRAVTHTVLAAAGLRPVTRNPIQIRERPRLPCRWPRWTRPNLPTRRRASAGGGEGQRAARARAKGGKGQEQGQAEGFGRTDRSRRKSKEQQEQGQRAAKVP